MENMKTIAVIESCDTKFKEAKFISDFIKNEGLNALVINTATVLHHLIIMTSQEKRSQKVMAHLGKRWSQSQKVRRSTI